MSEPLVFRTKGGTAQQAVSTAQKLFVEILTSDDNVWAFMVATALKRLAIRDLGNVNTTDELKRLEALISVETRKTDPEEILTLVTEKREKLWGTP